MHYSPIHLKNGPLECVQNVKNLPIENFKFIKQKMLEMAHWQTFLPNPCNMCKFTFVLLCSHLCDKLYCLLTTLVHHIDVNLSF